MARQNRLIEFPDRALPMVLAATIMVWAMAIQAFSSDPSLVIRSHSLAAFAVLGLISSYVFSADNLGQRTSFLLLGTGAVVLSVLMTSASSEPLNPGLTARVLELLCTICGALYFITLCRENKISSGLLTMTADTTVVWFALCLSALLLSAGIAPNWWGNVTPEVTLLVVNALLAGLLSCVVVEVYAVLKPEGFWARGVPIGHRIVAGLYRA